MGAVAMGWRDDLVAVLGFFSRVPVPAPRHGLSLATAAWALPLAAVVIAVPGAAVMGLAVQLGLPPLAAATLGLGVLVALTGALHEDGFGDCADAFWGGATPERRLEILRDPRAGSFAVLALALSTVLRIALLAEAVRQGTLGGMALFVAAAVAGRTVSLYPWVGLPPARAGGLAVAAGRPTAAAFRKALVVGLVAVLVLAGWTTLLGAFAGVLAAAAAAKGVAVLADAKLGGVTGDVIGAAVVAGEIAFLLAALPFL